jgi:hypothetical protein
MNIFISFDTQKTIHALQAGKTVSPEEIGKVLAELLKTIKEIASNVDA